MNNLAFFSEIKSKISLWICRDESELSEPGVESLVYPFHRNHVWMSGAIVAHCQWKGRAQRPVH